MSTHIIPTSTAEHLVRGLERVIFPAKNREGKRYFPDSEIYLKIPEIAKLKNQRIVVLHSGAPKPNQGLIELEIILEILKNNKIKPEVFFSYFPYSQQDKIFEKGEANLAEGLVKKLVNYYQVRKIFIIDPHFGREKWAGKYPIKCISAIPLLMKKARRNFGSPSRILPNKTWGGKDVLFLSPDKGGKRRTGISGIKKERINSFRVKYFSPEINLKGKTVAVVDDLIETGATLLKFHDFLKKSGAEKVIALITHGVLASGVLKIKSRYQKLYLTNTINQKEANIDIADLISKTTSGPSGN